MKEFICLIELRTFKSAATFERGRVPAVEVVGPSALSS